MLTLSFTLEHPLTVLQYIRMPLGRPAAGSLRISNDLRICQVLRQADIAHESHLGDFEASDVPGVWHTRFRWPKPSLSSKLTAAEVRVRRSAPPVYRLRRPVGGKSRDINYRGVVIVHVRNEWEMFSKRPHRGLLLRGWFSCPATVPADWHCERL